MNIGIIGLPQTGKKTLFEVLTQHAPSENDLASNKAIKGIAEIKDQRFDKLVAMHKPKKEVRARIYIELLPKIEKDAAKNNETFKDIAELDAICHVVRAFKDESIYHVDGSIDPARDIKAVDAELILNDLLFIEKRLERIDKGLKKMQDTAAAKEKELLMRLKAHLDKEMPLRSMGLGAEEKKTISGYPFITLKKMIIALNISEGDLNSTRLLDQLKEDFKVKDISIMQVSAKLESEIAKLENEEEKTKYLSELDIEEPAINILTRLCIEALNLISFFTVGQDEVRQWTVKAGSLAPEAAGAIHSDMFKGFIRAEVMKCEDLIALGSEVKVKESGKFYLKGKDYIVEDGDVLGIRFNV